MSDKERIDLFIKDVRRKCREYGVKLILKRSQKLEIEEGMYGGGYFDPETKTLAVAKYHVDFLALLVHESCHLDQWCEEAKVWKKSYEGDAGNELDEFLNGKEVSNIRAALNRVKALELDCERRSLVKINQYELPINQVVYAQKANAYLQFHNYMLLSKKWHTSPYSDPNIYSIMPKRMMSDSYYKRLPLKIKRVFDQFLR